VIGGSADRRIGGSTHLPQHGSPMSWDATSGTDRSIRRSVDPSIRHG
jgi:hypothetical protein